MENDVKVFKSPLFGDVRTAGTSDSPLFCLADVCKALELRTSDVIRRLDDGVVSTHPILDSMGRWQEANFVNEDGLYDVILDSRKPEAKKFRKWVTGEVLPAIRRTGRYGRDVLANSRHRELLLGLHDMLEARDKQVQLLEEFLEASERKVHDLTHRLEQLTPGSRFAEAVKTSEQSILIGDLARILRANGVDTGQTRLFQWMRDNGYLIKRQGESYNQPTIRALEMGLFEIKKTVVTRADGTSLVTTTPKVTGKGQVYFVDKMSAGIAGEVIRKIGCAGVV